jgi:hypothetical protein
MSSLIASRLYPVAPGGLRFLMKCSAPGFSRSAGFRLTVPELICGLEGLLVDARKAALGAESG